MEIQQAQFKDIPNYAFGIVIRGCDLSTQEHRDGFINGVVGFLTEHGVIPKGTKPEQVFEKLLHTTTPKQFVYGQGEVGGRNDLVYVFKETPEVQVNMGRFALVRLHMPDCSWIEDWLVNDAKFYNSEPRGIHVRKHFDDDDEE